MDPYVREPGTFRKLLLAIGLGLAVYFGIMTLLEIPGFKVTKTIQDEVTIYRWSVWMSLAPILIAFALFGISWLLLQWPTLRVCLLIVGALALVSGLTFTCLGLFSPVRYEVAVASDRFEQEHGDPWASRRRICRFEDMEAIDHRTTWSLGLRRGIPYPSHASHLWILWKAGTREPVTVGGLLEDALPDVLSRAQASGVRIINQEE